MQKPKFEVGEVVEVCLGDKPYRVTEIQEVIPDLGKFLYRVKLNEQLSDMYDDRVLRSPKAV